MLLFFNCRLNPFYRKNTVFIKVKYDNFKRIIENVLGQKKTIVTINGMNIYI